LGIYLDEIELPLTGEEAPHVPDLALELTMEARHQFSPAAFERDILHEGITAH
jgi:hypothetical protein